VPILGSLSAASRFNYFDRSAYFQPPIISGLVGHYDVDSVRPTVWEDRSGLNNHATLAGSPTIATNSSAFGSSRAFKVLQGGPTSRITWPTAILPSQYTLFYVARYNTSNANTNYPLLRFNAGTSTSEFVTPFGWPITSISGELRVTYSSAQPDEIWMGSGGFLNNSPLQSNKTYLTTFEGRASNTVLANGNNRFYQLWDSTSGITDVSRSATIMSLERRRSDFVFNTASSFNRGNMWMRGHFNSSTTSGSDFFGFFRNFYMYEVVQPNVNTIFTGFDKSWYSGFFAGKAGVGYHGNTLTETNVHSNNWVLGTDSNANGSNQLLRTNKVDRYNAAGPANMGSSFARLSVNPEAVDYGTNWQIAEVIVYNRGLTSGEYVAVENYLSTKYGVA